MPNNDGGRISLNHLKNGTSGVIKGLRGDKVGNQRLMALGIVRGQRIALETNAPLNDPKIYSIMGYRLSIRNEDAGNILVAQS